MIIRWRIRLQLLVVWLLSLVLGAQKFHTYVGQIGATSALIA